MRRRKIYAVMRQRKIYTAFNDLTFSYYIAGMAKFNDSKFRRAAARWNRQRRRFLKLYVRRVKTVLKYQKRN